MPKKTLYHILRWAITIAACAFLVWKIVTYDDYASLVGTLRTMNRLQGLALLLCVALMPLNMAIEAWRWRTLMNDATSSSDGALMDWKAAQRQVYYSKLAGLITPWRLGEYPSRALLMEQENPSAALGKHSAIWAKVLSMGAVGSATMTAAIVIAGVPALAFSPAVLTFLGGSYLYSLAAVILVLTALFLAFPRILKSYVSVSADLLLRSTAQSLVRLLCWCLQLVLVLYALGAIYNLQFTIYNLFVYYLLVTVTPNVPIAEVGVRGAWAILLFGSMNAALAGVLLWVINTLLPCLVALFFAKK
ncbi:MAG: flippase-like domain-containing protein [Paludibacteraceae bacterium]|nr:flippase-like domain-containing protein [Paludibacteraceae bacterium]